MHTYSFNDNLFPKLFPRSVVIITGSGYIKRMPLEEFEAQSRGGKGKIGARLSTEQDNVAHFFACNDHDTLIFVTDRYVACIFDYLFYFIVRRRWCWELAMCQPF